MLTSHELERYSRQISFPHWGKAGQETLQHSTVCVAGAGGLGSAVALYLAAAGVGHLRICDSDVVELSNLNRQILHTAPKIGVLKAKSARQTLHELNPTIQIDVFPIRMTLETVEEVVGASQIIVDCLDNFPSRRILNRYAATKQIPFLYAGVQGMEGMVSMFHPPETPCLECIFPNDPESTPPPVIGAIPGLVGSIQALETLKYLLGIGELLTGKLLIVDGMRMTFQPIQIEPNPECPICSSAA